MFVQNFFPVLFNVINLYLKLPVDVISVQFKPVTACGVCRHIMLCPPVLSLAFGRHYWMSGQLLVSHTVSVF